jgi:hypothetical protein
MFGLFVTLSFAEKQGGTVTAQPDPINPTQNVVIHYNGTGTNFANWTPKCHVHIWLVPKAGQTFTGNYDISWNSVDGDAQYAALDDKFKMTHDGHANSGQYDITINLQSYFGISNQDLHKIDQIGIVVRSQYIGDTNQTIDFFLDVNNFTYSEIIAESDVNGLQSATITGVSSKSELQGVSEKFGASSTTEVDVYLSSNVTLTDKNNFNCPKLLNVTNNLVTYTRQAYRDGGWETLMLPFDVTSTLPSDFEFQELDTGEDNSSVIHFRSVSSLSANTPYVMRYTGATNSEKIEVSFSGTAVQTNISASSNSHKFTGVFTNSVISDYSGYNIYGMNTAGTQFVKINTPNTDLYAYRAFLKVSTGASAPAYKVLLGGTSGIEASKIEHFSVIGGMGAIKVKSLLAQNISIYTVDAKLVRTVYVNEGETIISNLLPGIYIVNNLKVIVK